MGIPYSTHPLTLCCLLTHTLLQRLILSIRYTKRLKIGNHYKCELIVIKGVRSVVSYEKFNLYVTFAITELCLGWGF